MLDRLSPRHGSRRPRKRVGRGPGSGIGRNSGRGEKGQGHRSPGRETPFHFEGGQMPLARRLPKRGFHNLFRTLYRIVNVGSLSAFEAGSSVDPAALEAHGLIAHGREGVKLLGEGDAPRELQVKVHRVSAGARAKIEAAGGKVEVIE
ncbi:MAG: 50S ribosomal protein L15 [Myxococcales bacterium]|nr:50S ribosomal protein L15 [Myxococcales bacterium]